MSTSTKTQNLANHTRYDPAFHFFLAPLFLLTLILQIVRTVRHPTYWNAWLILVALGAVAAVTLMRVYSLRVQDRVIRLEEQLRLTLLSGGAMRARLSELSTGQLVALRFACDDEACALAERAISERLTPKQIKQAVRSWRPDFHRV